jgi:Phospholipase_D-nuclease N-terminal
MITAMPLAAQDYPLLNLFWTMLLLFFWVLWFYLLFLVIADIFRSDDLGGWGKALWLIFVIVVPYLGVFVYLIARGTSMGERRYARRA